MKSGLTSLFAAVMAGFLLVAATGTAGAVEVEVQFAKYLIKNMPAIDALEREREEQFRKFRQTERTNFNNSRRLAHTRWSNVNWANEVLVPDYDDFSVTELTRRMVAASLERAGVSNVAKVEIRIDRLFISNYSLTALAGPNSYASGTITAYDASGKVIASSKLVANLVVDKTVAPNYNGSDFAFPDTSRNLRVGPTLSYFVFKGLGKLFPGREFARPVLITF